MQIPIIETERLLLREFRDNTDFDAYAEFYGSDLANHYDGPLDRSVAWRPRLCNDGPLANKRLRGAWAVEKKFTGYFCGIVGLWFPEGWPEREIKWHILTVDARKFFE